jgi:phage gp29-like protein
MSGIIVPPQQMQSIITRNERFRSSGSFGSMTGERLTSLLRSAEQGYFREYTNFCQFVEQTDPEIAGLYETRRMRVRQANVVIAPGRASPTPDDVLLTSMCRDVLDRIENLDDVLDDLLSAIGCGHSYAEMDLEADVERMITVPTRIQWMSADRTRLDEQWRSRLYDSDHVGVDGYGSYLQPFKWLHHSVKSGASYPGCYGVTRTIAWLWLFRRWADTFWIETLDRFGQPHIWAKVAPGTPSQVRNELKTALDNFTAEHTAVFEATGDASINIEAAAAALDNGNFKSYQEYCINSLTKRILGTSDAASPGANGSNAAVATRTASTMDPRTIADARALWSTIRRDLFGAVRYWNRWKFASEPVLPVAKFDFEMAGDKDASTAVFDPGQMREIMAVVGQVNRREITRAQGKAAIRMFCASATEEQTDGLIGTGGVEDASLLANAAPAQPSTPTV